jgi:hypothetical protein
MVSEISKAGIGGLGEYKAPTNEGKRDKVFKLMSRLKSTDVTECPAI